MVDDAAPTTAYWTLNATDERGHVVDETLGNGLQTVRTFDRVTGWVGTISTGNGTIQDLSYAWDKVGNLSTRTDVRQSKSESFGYDHDYRLTSVTGPSNMTITYDTLGLGNIASKTGVGSYTYSPTKPHQVTSTADGQSFTYDANGNMSTRNGSTIDWTNYNLPKKIREGSDSAEFRYGPARARYKQINIDGGATETTYYVGGLYERVTKGSVTKHKHYIVASGEAIAIRTLSSGADATTYLHHDHLGDVDTITDSTTPTPQVVVRLSYDAFGKRRGATWTGDPTSGDLANIANTTHRGFTVHEHLDNIGLIHMNGRVYDPTIGRFLSADPFVTEPLNSQSFNRYGYVNNNPLSFVDPSGFATTPCNDCNGGGEPPSEGVTMDEIVDLVQSRSPWAGAFGGVWAAFDYQRHIGIPNALIRLWNNTHVRQIPGPAPRIVPTIDPTENRSALPTNAAITYGSSQSQLATLPSDIRRAAIGAYASALSGAVQKGSVTSLEALALTTEFSALFATDAATFVDDLGVTLARRSLSDPRHTLGGKWPSFNDTGFASRFRDSGGNQVFHFFGGFLAGAAWGQTRGTFASRAREYGEYIRGRGYSSGDLLLGDVAASLGAQIATGTLAPADLGDEIRRQLGP